MEGYDYRERASKKMKSSFGRAGSNVGRYYGFTHSKSQQVTSFRDTVDGIPVPSSQADPYGWLIEAGRQRKRKLAIEQGSLGAELPPVVDEGHPFETTKNSFSTSLPGTNVHWWAPIGGGAYRLFSGGPGLALGAAPLLTLQPAMPFKFATPTNNGPKPGLLIGSAFTTQIAPPSFNPLSDFGKKAIRIVAPGRPAVDVFASLGELLAGFPRIPGHTLERVTDSWKKRGAGEFLNYVFGVQPTINDIAKLVDSMSTLTTAIIQLRRDSGRGVRRSFDPTPFQREWEYPSSDLSSQGSVQLGHTNQVGYRWSNQTTSDVHRAHRATYTSTLFLRKYEKLRFTGSFTYWLPKTPLEGLDWSQVAELNRIIRFAPSLTGVWQLIPWSWLIDWFFDISSTLELIERTQDDSLVINYGYAMRHTVCTATQKTEVSTPANYKFEHPVVKTVTTFEKKERIRSNPYGFIVPTASEMTPMRWAILAAIGLGRSPRGGYN